MRRIQRRRLLAIKSRRLPAVKFEINFCVKLNDSLESCPRKGSGYVNFFISLLRYNYVNFSGICTRMF